MVCIHALVSHIFLQANQVKKHLGMLLGEEAVLHSLVPLAILVSQVINRTTPSKSSFITHCKMVCIEAFS
jgi:hypothetical protein